MPWNPFLPDHLRLRMQRTGFRIEEASVIRKEMTIEELVAEVPESVRYLMQKGIKCLACGEPIWETLESAARAKGFGDEQIDGFVADFQKMALQSTRNSNRQGN